ncbi:MAG TPA: peptidoglycan DD-metalloendopeptidase family protein [Actinomycetota bacterium]|nr:peptidoglycan DD-metalloendopeptidase family protein [Actinomycetota bacterium]
MPFARALVAVAVLIGAAPPVAAAPAHAGLAVRVAAPARGAAVPWLVPPVAGAITRSFEVPGTEWGPGHRGIDLAVAAGTQVRAAAAGTVSFAGSVGSRVAVTVEHGSGLETTYSDLSSIAVARGDTVRATTWIGTAGVAHDQHDHGTAAATGGIHFGVKLNGVYVDPALYLGPLDTGSAIHLAPLVWEPPPTLPATFRAPFLSASAPAECESKGPLPAAPAAPTPNLAVLVAGIGSKTKGATSAALYEAGHELLGYEPADIYPFSYRGSNAPRLHEPYERRDTFHDINRAALELRTLLVKLARRHPGRAVDLLAHSQGGIVARTYVSSVAEAWDPELPRIEHLVTFSSPHQGAPLAGARDVLDATIAGRAFLRGASSWSRNGGPLPDPYAASVEQLAPGSPLLNGLARETVVYGTRVLTLSIPTDVVVPANVSRWPGHDHSVIPPTGLNAHDAIVTSRVARGIAHGFLRGAPAACRDGWDLWGPRLGRAIAGAETWLPRGYRALEALLLGG